RTRFIHELAVHHQGDTCTSSSRDERVGESHRTTVTCHRLRQPCTVVRRRTTDRNVRARDDRQQSLLCCCIRCGDLVPRERRSRVVVQHSHVIQRCHVSVCQCCRTDSVAHTDGRHTVHIDERRYRIISCVQLTLQPQRLATREDRSRLVRGRCNQTRVADVVVVVHHDREVRRIQYVRCFRTTTRRLTRRRLDVPCARRVSERLCLHYWLNRVIRDVGRRIDAAVTRQTRGCCIRGCRDCVAIKFNVADRERAIQVCSRDAVHCRCHAADRHRRTGRVAVILIEHTNHIRTCCSLERCCTECMKIGLRIDKLNLTILTSDELC